MPIFRRQAVEMSWLFRTGFAPSRHCSSALPVVSVLAHAAVTDRRTAFRPPPERQIARNRGQKKCAGPRKKFCEALLFRTGGQIGPAKWPSVMRPEAVVSRPRSSLDPRLASGTAVTNAETPGGRSGRASGRQKTGVDQRNARRLSRVCTWANSIATPSAK